MTREKCGIAGCGKVANLGNGIRYEKVYDETGKRISLPICTKCNRMIETRRRPK